MQGEIYLSFSFNGQVYPVGDHVLTYALTLAEAERVYVRLTVALREKLRICDIELDAPPDTGYCRAAGTTYTVQFQHPRARTVPITVRTLCGPMEQGGDKY